MKDKLNINKIVFFDFDGTLVNSPLPEEGKKIWKEKTGKDYPYEGWWGKAESLDTNIFDIDRNNKIYNILREEIKSETTLCVLLTNRIVKLKPAVLGILKNLQIVLDDYMLLNSSQKKSDRVVDYIEELPAVKQVVVYDDMDDQISNLKTLKSRLNQLDVSIYRVNKDIIIKEEVINLITKSVLNRLNINLMN